MALLGASGAIGAGAALFMRSASRPLVPDAIPLLRYRCVGPQLPGSPLNASRVSIPNFARHMRYLKRRRFRPVTLSEALDHARDPDFLASTPVAVCFDGAYQSFLDCALPTLRRLEIDRATVFVATAAIAGDNRYEVRGRGRVEPTIDRERLARLSAEGFELGSLGHSGRAFDLLGAGPMLADLQSSSAALKELTGTAPRCLAYPEDIVASSARACYRKAGFTAIASIGQEGVLERATPRDQLPRYPIGRGATSVELALALSLRAS